MGTKVISRMKNSKSLGSTSGQYTSRVPLPSGLLRPRSTLLEKRIGSVLAPPVNDQQTGGSFSLYDQNLK